MSNVLADEEVEMKDKLDLLNIFNTAYNKMYNTSGSLLKNINFMNKTSTNKKILMFLDEIKKYKDNEFKISDTDGRYCITYNSQTFSSNSLVQLLLQFMKDNEDWTCAKWSLTDNEK